MSIVDALNDLSGKSATTIDEAIGNIDLGGGGSISDIFMVNVTMGESITSDKTFEEIESAWTEGNIIVFKMLAPNGIAGNCSIANPVFQSDFMKPVAFTAAFIDGCGPTSLDGYMLDYRKANNTWSISYFSLQ